MPGHKSNKSHKNYRASWKGRHPEGRKEYSKKRKKLREEKRKIKLLLRKEKHLQIEEGKKQKRIAKYNKKYGQRRKTKTAPANERNGKEGNSNPQPEIQSGTESGVGQEGRR